MARQRHTLPSHSTVHFHLTATDPPYLRARTRRWYGWFCHDERVTVLDFKVSIVETGEGLLYGRYRIIRRAAVDDQIVWKGAGGKGATHRVWSWRTAFWPSPVIEELAKALRADRIVTKSGRSL